MNSHSRSTSPSNTLPTSAVVTPQAARRLGANYRLPLTAAEILSQASFVPQCSHKVMPPCQYLTYEVSIWSDIGTAIPSVLHWMVHPFPFNSPFFCISFFKRPYDLLRSAGNRRTQEDRCIFCSQLIEGRDDTGFFGVFDGTVGDFASDNVKHLVVPHLIGSPPWYVNSYYIQPMVQLICVLMAAGLKLLS